MTARWPNASSRLRQPLARQAQHEAVRRVSQFAQVAAPLAGHQVGQLGMAQQQRATTDMLIHSIQRQIAYISTFTPLEAGDVIVTGTPGGVGAKRSPPVFMKAGDVVEVAVDAVGTLRNVVREE